MSKVIKSVIVIVLCVAVYIAFFYIAPNYFGMFREFHGINLVVETKNVKLYESMLPKPLQMPERPMVIVYIAKFTSVWPWPMTPYLEGSVILRCKHNGVDGWHVKTMPVTTYVANSGGRMMGFPKYIADEITLRQEGDGWRGEVILKGKSVLSIMYRQGLTRPLAAWEKALIDSGAFHFDEPIFLFVPPDKGPRLQRVMLEKIKQEHWKTELGTARTVIDKNEPWAGLVSDDKDAMAVFQQFTGGRTLKEYKLD
jgi:hypothetical protein